MELEHGCGKVGGDFTLNHTFYSRRFVFARNDHYDALRLHNVLNTHRKRLLGYFVDRVEKTGVILNGVFRQINQVGNGRERRTRFVETDVTVRAKTQYLYVGNELFKERVVTVTFLLKVGRNTAGKVGVFLVDIDIIEEVGTHKVRVALVVISVQGNVFVEVDGGNVLVCKKIFTVNRLENKEGRSFFREVFIRRGQVSGVYGVEEPRECYMTYTTERAEKEALKLYKSELGCNHQQAIEAYCRDWKLSGIDKSLPFAQKVNQTGHVLNLKPKEKQ